MSTHAQYDLIQDKHTGSKNQTIRHMHKYVLVMVGVFVLFIMTFPMAYVRVSQSNKYGGDAFKSLKWEEAQRAKSSNISPRGTK
ncbi:MAG: hypothetical protein QNJ51_07920 [Calothrix sp. MO_167.B12]|nr:hypothetical protein [Calothrix sp. MO_167.B12]